MPRVVRWPVFLGVLALSAGALAQTFPTLPRIYYVSFPSSDLQKPLTVSAQLRLPVNTQVGSRRSSSSTGRRASTAGGPPPRTR